MYTREAPPIGLVTPVPGKLLTLLAGQVYVGNKPARIRTLLGSCVAITLWHPRRRVGGMCHFLLPGRNRPAGAPLDARYGDEALAIIMSALRGMGTPPGEFETHLYGGADTMPDRAGVKLNIGERNIEQGCILIDRHGFELHAVDVGDYVPRTVELDLTTGRVEMRRGQALRVPA